MPHSEQYLISMASLRQCFPDRRRPALREPAPFGHVKIIDRMPPLGAADAMQRIGVVRITDGAARADQAGGMLHAHPPRRTTLMHNSGRRQKVHQPCLLYATIGASSGITRFSPSPMSTSACRMFST